MANPAAFKRNAPINRLQGELPRIGIRPTIDGRMNGVRESLEDQVMNLAKAAAALIENNVKHSCGLPVECVIADSTIAGLAESAACADKFRRMNVGVTLTVTVCWCYGSETMDMDPHTIKAVWGFNGTERPGAVYLAAALAAHAQKGLPAFSIYGRDVLDAGDTSIPADVEGKILRFARAALAAATMRGKSYLAMGGTSMGIAGSIISPDFLEAYLGMRCQQIDMVELLRRWNEGIYDKEEFERAYKWVNENITMGWDPNDPTTQDDAAKKEDVLRKCIIMTLAARDLMIGNPRLKALGFGEEALGHNAILAGFQGQRQWTDHLPNGDFMESILSSSFDWNGIREPLLVATENDHLNGVAMLFGHLLTGAASVFADVRTYWSPEAVERVTGWKPTGLAKDGFIHLLNSGAAALDGAGCQSEDGHPAMKPFWNISAKEAADCVAATQYCYGNKGYFRGGGYSSQFLTKGGMPVTLMRINLIKGLGPVMQLAEGFSCELPASVSDTLNKRTDATWPCTWFVPKLTGEGPFKDVYSVMANWGANHGAFAYGHVGADVIAMCAMLRIPVCMHNVAAQDVFRPAAWAAFGTENPESADYRACAAYGPLYGEYR